MSDIASRVKAIIVRPGWKHCNSRSSCIIHWSCKI